MALRANRTRGSKKLRLHKPVWIDPYPGIPGTEPEKRVFAQLMDMRIFFIYQGQIPEFQKGKPMFTYAVPGYKPDFVLPEYRIIIDPFSPFHHSLEEAVERDVRKVVAYSVAGYAYYHPWAMGAGEWTWDQYHDSRKQLVTRDKKGRVVSRISLYGGVNSKRNSYRGFSRVLHGVSMGTYDMIRSIPEIRRGPMYKLTDPRLIAAKKSPGYEMGEYLTVGPDGLYHSPGDKSVGAANRRRRKPPLLAIRVGTRRGARRTR